jgi:hypothetical protein
MSCWYYKSDEFMSIHLCLQLSYPLHLISIYTTVFEIDLFYIIWQILDIYYLRPMYGEIGSVFSYNLDDIWATYYLIMKYNWNNIMHYIWDYILNYIWDYILNYIWDYILNYIWDYILNYIWDYIFYIWVHICDYVKSSVSESILGLFCI